MNSNDLKGRIQIEISRLGMVEQTTTALAWLFLTGEFQLRTPGTLRVPQTLSVEDHPPESCFFSKR
jgi:hypothetical protein